MANPVYESGRSLALESVPNARELGGYIMSDGRRIRKGCLFRCGALDKASDRDISYFVSSNVKYVFDYRTKEEQEHHPDRPIPGAFHISLPCIDPEKDLVIGSEFSKNAGRPGFEDFLVGYAFTEEAKEISSKMYRTLVLSEYSQLQYGTFLNYAARDEDGSLLWHCSQGKDRTGLGAAFLLFSLGASKELVVADFDISNKYYLASMNQVIEKVKERGGREEEVDVVKSLLGANTRRFSEALDTIDSHFGSMSAYINYQLCLSENEISIMKKRYLE